MNTLSSAPLLASKQHYELLDGLRGVAALLVLIYHVFEGYAFAAGEAVIGGINHGYLAVDFFFMLSGFVIGYAYDDRFRSGSLTLSTFFRRRIVRLHPMVIFGALFGAVAYLLQGSVAWDGTHVGLSMVMLSLLLALFMIPTLPGAAFDVRGNGEMYPLNGPAWSLFFEYLGNILYALLLRRLSTKALSIVVAGLGAALAGFIIADVSGYGMLGIGWTLDAVNFVGGLLRMLFPFSFGLLLSRGFKSRAVRGAFWWCALMLTLLFVVPFIPGLNPVCWNGVYEAFCIFVAFPVVLILGASGRTTDRRSTQICRFLGEVSYPVYIIHYPIYYLFYAWLIDSGRHAWSETWLVSTLVIVGSIAVAALVLRCYDLPVRRWLAKR